MTCFEVEMKRTRVSPGPCTFLFSLSKNYEELRYRGSFSTPVTFVESTFNTELPWLLETSFFPWEVYSSRSFAMGSFGVIAWYTVLDLAPYLFFAFLYLALYLDVHFYFSCHTLMYTFGPFANYSSFSHNWWFNIVSATQIGEVLEWVLYLQLRLLHAVHGCLRIRMQTGLQSRIGGLTGIVGSIS